MSQGKVLDILEFLESPKPDKKKKYEVFCKPSTWREFNIIKAELVMTQGDCLQHLCETYRERTINVAGIRR